jgi:hypothetical protein
VRLDRELFLQCARCFYTFAVVVILLVAPVFARTAVPEIVSSRGYINATPLIAHTTAPFSSESASALVAFVSSHPLWNGQPVSVLGLSDNLSNGWKTLTSPTVWAGDRYTLLSAIYYVNAPVTSSVHTLTIKLSNPAPLVVHVFAVSGSDIASTPIHSAITNVDVYRASGEVTGAPITVPAGTLLLCWVKNESQAPVTVLDDYVLDQQSTDFLWAESRTVYRAGWYASHFHYNTAIGWQTAIVGLRPTATPVASSEAVATNQDAPVRIALNGLSLKGVPLTWILLSRPTHGVLFGVAPNLTYLPDADYTGSDMFTYKINDGVAPSNTARVAITVKRKTFLQGLRDKATTLGIFSIIWVVAVWMALPRGAR